MRSWEEGGEGECGDMRRNALPILKTHEGTLSPFELQKVDKF